MNLFWEILLKIGVIMEYTISTSDQGSRDNEMKRYIHFPLELQTPKQ